MAMAHTDHGTKTSMKQAVEAVEKGMVSVHKAAELYNVPHSTLHDKASGKTVEDARSGPQPYLSPEEEEELTSFLLLPKSFIPILESKSLHWCSR